MIIRLITFSFFIAICYTTQAQVKISYKDANTASVVLVEQDATFVNQTIDLGKIKKGDKKETIFTFKNTGIKDLEIELVSACECTTLDWTRGKIKPRGTGEIKVIFDSAEKDANENSVDVDIYFKPLENSDQDPLFEICTFTFEIEE